MVDEGPKTSPALLKRLQAWDDRTAWNCFFEQYNPLLERWSRSTLRNPGDAIELSQLVLWELARRLREFRYDPARSFRGWLRTLHTRRMLDFLSAEQRRRNQEQRVFEVRRPSPVISLSNSGSGLTATDQAAQSRQAQQALAMKIQQRVRERVTEKTWAIFWEIAVEGHSIAETAERHSMRYASAFAAFSRVHKMLQKEASREQGQ
jgi:RNA polymerase sigma-70 factor (ECF subfamily)